MPFIAHTPEDIQAMLNTIGVDHIQDLFDEIPAEICPRRPLSLEAGLDEKTLSKIMHKKARQDRISLSFIGAGAYEHFIPATVWAITSRGEFMTAYTPYQAEASQGSLQLIYEYQSMMTELMALDLSNASLYDGASALAEAILMAIRIQKNSDNRKVLLVGPFAPWVLDAVQSITEHQDVILDCQNITTLISQPHFSNNHYAAVVIAQPNFSGQIVEVDALTDWAHQHKSVVIAYVNPLAMALLKPPGEWGTQGADIACGEGQPLGIPLSFGGPYFGFLCCRLQDARQMPGRIVGKTKDADGQEAFCLTLQAREQHIRRAKATSNICTNQGLMVTAATIYMTLLGSEGLYQVARASHENAYRLMEALVKIPNVRLAATGPFYCEFPVCLPVDAHLFLQRMEDEHHIQAGYCLDQSPERENIILITTTEVHDAEDHETYIRAFKTVLNTLIKEKS